MSPSPVPVSSNVGEIALGIARTSFLRLSSRAIDAPRGHREWLHFSVGAGDPTLLVNVSVVDDLRPSAPRGSERGRVIVVVRDGDRWDGGVDEVSGAELQAHCGTVSAGVGETLVELQNGRFRVAGRLRARPIAFDLELTPSTFPSLASNVAIGAGEDPINWVVVPALRADGWLTVDGERRELRGAPAYHDHNWGYFTHRDFSWQWGHVHPDDPSEPFSVVFTRLLDGPQANAYMQAVLLWRGARQHRVLREDEVRVTTEGLLRKEPFTVPPRGKLLAGGVATDVPRRLRFDAGGDGDALTGCFDADDVARIVLPNDHDLGTTLIHEVMGRFTLRGHVRGERIDFAGRAVFEFLGREP